MSGSSEGDSTRILWEARTLNYHGVGALCFLLWDYMLTFGDEVKYIWPQSRRSPTKWIFLFTRYFGLLAQSRLLSVSLALPLGTPSVEDCRVIYTTQVVCGGILMACIQGVLMLRVYALYTQDRRIAVAMMTLLIAEVGSMPGLIHMTLPNDVGTMCMKPITFRDIALFGVSAIFPQLLVLGLTILKFFSGLRDGWGPIPIVSRLVRDDIILVAVIVAWVVISAALTSINTMYGYVGYGDAEWSSACSVWLLDKRGLQEKVAFELNRPHNSHHASSSSTHLKISASPNLPHPRLQANRRYPPSYNSRPRREG